MRILLVAVLALAACSKPKAVEPPPAPKSVRASIPIERLTPQQVKAKVEGAEKQHEERIDKRFDEAQKQGE